MKKIEKQVKHVIIIKDIDEREIVLSAYERN